MVWNCRGVGSPLTVPQLREVIRLHSPSLVFLSETKKKKSFLNSVKQWIKFDNVFVVDPVGLAGGLAVLWKQELKVKKVLFTSFTIELLIDDWEIGAEWWCICVYASTNASVRREQWKVLERRNIGFEGVPWTWCNNWKSEGEVKERIDRILGNTGWIRRFEKAKCTHIETEASDHCILLLDTKPERRRWKRRFMFDRRWLQHSDIEEVVGGAWERQQGGSRMYMVQSKIRRVRMDLLGWSKQKCGNSKSLILKVKQEIQEVKESRGDGYRIKLAGLKRKLAEAYKQEEIYWSQKARVKWLQEGDKNTSYFHAKVVGRRRMNRISVLKNSSGVWCKDEEETCQEIVEYFQHIYTSERPEEFSEILEGIPQTITDEMNMKLTRKVTEQEISQAVFSMHPNKSPGPDGMSPVFFQKFWSILKVDIICAVNSFFDSGFILKSINETLISLIPKIELPSTIADLRHISLCNVLYKIISKVITNRFKHVLNYCISCPQSAFVHGRQILDNVLIAHEVIHFLKNKRTGRDGYMAIKIDMAKAYDRVEWNFLAKVMLRMGFCPKWIQWVMQCVSSVTYAINFNGEKRGFIRPTRGLRQGDPLSPYLFLICAESFSSLLKQSVVQGKLTGIRIAREAPRLSHLFFADDALIFCKATAMEAGQLRRILEVYREASGQLINMEKSSLFFSRNVVHRYKAGVLRELQGMKEAQQSRYLGLPLVIGRSKRQTFDFVKQKTLGRLEGWKEKLLSQAGKEVLLKSVIMALPIYVMSCCILPKDLCRQISSGMAKFWWGQKEKKHRIHWLSWGRLADGKEEGGLGFRELHEFNLALLAKQLWRILTRPNLLMSKVMRARYFKGISIWAMKSQSTDSWWLPNSGNGKVKTPRAEGVAVQWLSELIKDGKWDRELIAEVFEENEGKDIVRIPLSVCSMKDRIYWSKSSTGEYTVKSGYRLAKCMRKEVAGDRSIAESSSSRKCSAQSWCFLWGMNLKQKLKHFIWKCLQNILPVNASIKARCAKGDHMCGCCGEHPETVEHLLFFCDHAKAIWEMAPVSWEGLVIHRNKFWHWWEELKDAVYKEQGQERIAVTINLLWQIWKSRNARQFEAKARDPMTVVQKAVGEWREYQDAQVKEGEPVSGNRVGKEELSEWKEPREAWVKINSDAAVHQNKDKAGWGLVARSWQKELVGVWAVPGVSCSNPKVEEALALRAAMLVAKCQGWRRVEFETNCKQVIDRINSGENDVEIATVLSDIEKLKLSFYECCFSFTRRKSNSVSHQVAKFATNLKETAEWKSDFPVWLLELVQADCRGSCPKNCKLS
ncbi:uncharacterized protein [Coffea arabica]|uniref:Reverse transcriptase domain-containing protein n=1 Tax=Coffea arabica TaxID=13443 RepID=A0ABM4V096_COFAR